MSKLTDLLERLCPDGVACKPLGEMVQIRNGRDWKSQAPGDIPVYGSGGRMQQRVAVASSEGPSVLLPRKGSLEVQYVDEPIWNVDTVFTTVCDAEVLNTRYFYFVMKSIDLGRISTSATRPSVTQSALRKLSIPVPPLEVQQEIVRVLDSFTNLEQSLVAEQELRSKQYEYYRSELLDFGDSVEWFPLAELAEYVNGKAHERLVSEEGTIPLVTARFISRNGEANRYVKLEDIQTPAQFADIAMVLSDLPNGRALARTFFVDGNDSYAINQRVARIRVLNHKQLEPRFLYYVLDRNPGLLKYDSGFDQTHLSKRQVTSLMIPLPPLRVQREVVERLDKLSALVNDMTSGIPAEIDLRRKQYEFYRDELLRFIPKEA